MDYLIYLAMWAQDESLYCEVNHLCDRLTDSLGLLLFKYCIQWRSSNLTTHYKHCLIISYEIHFIIPNNSILKSHIIKMIVP